MDEKTILAAACSRLGVTEDMVMSWKVYDNRVALVVDRGIAGCPKYTVPIAGLVTQSQAVIEETTPPKAEPAPIAPAPNKRKVRSK